MPSALVEEVLDSLSAAIVIDALKEADLSA